MTVAEKKRFVRHLAANIVDDVLAKVTAMPEEWDGNELRQYLADRFELGTLDFKKRMPAHYKAYKKVISVTGL